jgi:hypothetical protein
MYEKGYSDGWVANNYRETFGVWPKGLHHFVKEPTQEIRNLIKHRQIRFAKSKESKRAA